MRRGFCLVTVDLLLTAESLIPSYSCFLVNVSCYCIFLFFLHLNTTLCTSMFFFFEGFLTLMGDTYSAERRCSITQIICSDDTRGTLLDYFPLQSLTDYILIPLVSLTSYLSHRLIRFVEDLTVRDIERCRYVSGCSSHGQYRNTSSYYQDGLGERSSSSRSMGYNTNRLTYYRERDSNCSQNSCLTAGFEINGTEHCLRECLLIRGMMLPLHGFGLGWRLASTSLRNLLVNIRYTQVQISSFLSRLRRTFQGSSKDIGWLERTEGLPPVKDGTGRFLELLEGVRNGDHCLPNSFVYLLIPGLFSNLSPLYFVNTKRFFSKMGLACHIAKIHSEASVEKNSLELKQYIEELYWGSGKRVMILGHSKGGVDAAAALSLYWPILKNKVAGLALVQSPYGGSPIASDILRDGQVADREARRIMRFIICKLIKGDMRALEDLTYEKRKEFIIRHCLPSDDIPIISFHTEADIAPGVLATMSHIAHAELPWLPLPSFIREAEEETNLKVPVVIPLSAAMAASALHLKLRYGEASDGLVVRRDAEVPGSVVVRLDRRLDHAWMVYSKKTDGLEADASEMCEVLLTLLVEIGKNKRKSKTSLGF